MLGRPVALEPDEFAYQDLVELLTDDRQGTLSPRLVESLRAHLADRDGRGQYAEQFESTIRALRQAGQPSHDTIGK